MAVAAALFLVAGLLDGSYPGDYVFGGVNILFAFFIARGSERGLLLRIGLAAIFFVERILSAYALGELSIASVAVHLLTALVELVVLLTAMRVWRLGHSVDAAQLDALFALDAAPAESVTPEERPTPALQALPRITIAIFAASVLLGLALVAEGAQSALGGDPLGWRAFLFAAVLLVIAARAVHGRRLALLLLFAVGLLLLLERTLSPFLLGRQDPLSLALYVVGSFAAVALMLVSIAGLRAREAARGADVTDYRIVAGA